MDDNMSMTGFNSGEDTYTFSELSSTPSTFITVDESTISHMKDDLEAILENYLFELNNDKTHRNIEKNISAYFSGAWSEYPITHLSVNAISGHGVGVSLQIGDTPIVGDIGVDYVVDEYNVDFSITPEDLDNFGAFLKEWVDTVAPAEPIKIESVEDILFSAVKKT